LASDPHLPADFQAEKPGLDFQTDSIAVRPWNNDVVAGYSALKDVDGDSVLLLRVDSPRDIFRQGIATLNYFLAILCLFTLLLGVSAVALLRYTVLGRLGRLNSQIGEIGEKRDLTMRVSSSGTDEISKLGATVNTMLDALQNGDSHFRKIADNIRQVFWVKDEPTQEIAYISPPWESPSGISREHLFAGSSRSWLDSVYPEDRSIVDQMLKQQQEGIKGKAEYRIVGPNGDAWWTWCRYFPVFDDGGKLTQTVGLSEDMTEYKLTETVLQRSQDDLWNAMFSASYSPH
jgi:PAS domain S-box-containing protein